MKRFSIVWMAGALLLAAGCDGATAETEPEVQEGTLAACAFETFEVELTDGPSAPLKLSGTLYLVAASPEADGEFRGLFETDGGEYAVTASHTEKGDISVTVMLDEGQVVGLGHVEKLCESDASIEGVAVGPTVSADSMIDGTDHGHWLLFGGLPTLVTYQLTPYLGEDSTGTSIIKIPTNEVCKVDEADKASCYETFCKAQKAGHYSNDAQDGAICS
jgi:hypothetical protein